MSLRPTSSEAVPASTAAVARAAFPRGSPYLRLRDALGPVFADQQFAALFPRHGQPAEAPWRLALVTLLQFAESPSDRRAADAVRGRIDWKYLLGLELADPGFDASVLSEFRSRLVAGGAEELLLDTLLALCREHKLLVPRGRQRTDSTHVLGAIRALNRLGCAVEALRAALNALAAAAPEWLRQVPVPSVALLRRVWVQNFCLLPAGADTGAGPGMGGPIEGGTVVRWRTEAEGFPTSLLMIASPYDPEAHYARKRSTTWIGYKVHLTEACDDGRPRLITHVETTPAPVVDRDALGRVHEGLAAKDLLPDAHLVDAAYVDADQLIASERGHDVALVGPTPKDQQWQARTGEGFAIRDFTLDWDRRVATRPAGHTGQSWTADHNQGRTVMRIRFATADCKPCARKPRCIRGARRLLTPRRREEHAALEAARMRETEEAFAAQYRRRAGVEGTLSVGVRAMHLRRSRYIGLAKTHLRHVLTAAAINLARLGAWLAGEPLARTRQSAFVRLMTQPACARRLRQRYRKRVNSTPHQPTPLARRLNDMAAA
jgi:transposase